MTPQQLNNLSLNIKDWAQQLGFQQTGISGIELNQAEGRFLSWLEQGFHGEMDYMARHGVKRSRPAQLEPGTISVISSRMDYMVDGLDDAWSVINNPELGYVSRYALGRDYHKILRKRLAQLAKRIETEIGPFGYRVYTDSAPVMEKPLAQQAGLGWQGKHTNIINKQAGSWFFLGEIYTDLALPKDLVEDNHCGRCQSCIDVCPTQAIVAPYQLDARLCISYLTIELHGSIPVELRPLIGNRIYGCDDCQLICPWNKFAQHSQENDFRPRNDLDSPQLIDLFNWDEATFLKRTEGSPIRRIGHISWLRNIAVALGNAPAHSAIQKSLHKQLNHPSEMVQEHVHWAINQTKQT